MVSDLLLTTYYLLLTTYYLLLTTYYLRLKGSSLAELVLLVALFPGLVETACALQTRSQT